MSMIRKTLLLGCMSLLAAAFAIPASASAEITDPAHIFDVVTGLQDPAAVIQGAGTARFESLGGGTECTLEGEIVGENSTTGKATFSVNLATCVSFGALEGCEITKAEVTNQPNTVHAFITTKPAGTIIGRGILVTNVEIDNEYVGEGCPEEVVLVFPQIRLNVAAGPISKATVSGEGSAFFDGIGPFGNVASGEFKITKNSGTYEIKA